MNPKRLNHVESIRALAALCVALFHFTNIPYQNGYLVKSEKIRNFFAYGEQGVEMFYIISGFVITYSLLRKDYVIADYFKYVLKRIIRIFPPYFLTIAGIIGMGFLLNRFIWYQPYGVNEGEVLANLFFVVDLFPEYNWINEIFVTLKVEFQFYFLIGLIIPVIKTIRWRFIVFALLFLLTAYLTFGHNTVFQSAPYFLIGMICYFAFDRKWDIYLISLLSLILFILFNYYMLQDFVVAVVTISLIQILSSSTIFLNYTGKISYSLYLIHGLTGGWFLYFVSDYTFAYDHPIIIITLAILFSWFFASVMYEIVEKPTLWISSKVKYRNSQQKSLNSQS